MLEFGYDSRSGKRYGINYDNKTFWAIKEHKPRYDVVTYNLPNELLKKGYTWLDSPKGTIRMKGGLL